VGTVHLVPLHIGASAGQTCPQLPQLKGSFVGSMQAVPQHVRPLGHVPVEEHGPPPLSGKPASLPLDEPLLAPLDELLAPEDPVPEDDPLVETPELVPDSADASEVSTLVVEPPQWKAAATTDEAPTNTTYFERAAITSPPRHLTTL
jgi:hypothetical protein